MNDEEMKKHIQELWAQMDADKTRGWSGTVTLSATMVLDMKAEIERQKEEIAQLKAQAGQSESNVGSDPMAEGFRDLFGALELHPEFFDRQAESGAAMMGEGLSKIARWLKPLKITVNDDFSGFIVGSAAQRSNAEQILEIHQSYIDLLKSSQQRIAQLQAERDELKKKLESGMWFCYDDQGDYNEYATEKEALDSASDAIAGCLQEGWAEEVENIVVGRVMHRSTKCDVRTRPTADKLDEDGCDKDGYCWVEYDEICSYHMLPGIQSTEASEDQSDD